MFRHHPAWQILLTHWKNQIMIQLVDQNPNLGISEKEDPCENQILYENSIMEVS
jgi:hypothetical protein